MAQLASISIRHQVLCDDSGNIQMYYFLDASELTEEMDLSEELNKFSNFSKLQTVSAFCLRFPINFFRGGLKLVGSLTSMRVLIRRVHNQHFMAETSGIFPRGIKINSLQSFLDKDRLLRVGGHLYDF